MLKINKPTIKILKQIDGKSNQFELCKKLGRPKKYSSFLTRKIQELLKYHMIDLIETNKKGKIYKINKAGEFLLDMYHVK